MISAVTAPAFPPWLGRLWLICSCAGAMPFAFVSTQVSVRGTPNRHCAAQPPNRISRFDVASYAPSIDSRASGGVPDGASCVHAWGVVKPLAPERLHTSLVKVPPPHGGELPTPAATIN